MISDNVTVVLLSVVVVLLILCTCAETTGMQQLHPASRNEFSGLTRCLFSCLL